MTTSGTYVFSHNRDQLLRSALRKAGAFSSGEDIDSDAITDAAAELNSMIKHWQATGINIWTVQEVFLYPVANQVRYTLGSSTTDHATAVDVETTLASAASAGASTISVTSATGIATTYNIGIQLDDNTFQWTTVNGAPSGTTVTLSAVLTGAAASGNVVIVYQTSLVRPLKILSARRYNLDSGIDTPLTEMDRIEYQEMPNKTTAGSVNSYYYDRRGGANSTGLIYLWPAPADAGEIIKMTAARPIQDFNVAGDDADLPPEWTAAIEWNLALPLAIEYEAPQRKISNIEGMAGRLLDGVTWNERELVSYQLVPDFSR